MPKSYKEVLAILLVLSVLLVGTLGAGYASTHTQQNTTTTSQPKLSAKLSSTKMLEHHVVNMASTPALKASTRSASSKYVLPRLTGVSAAVEAQRKAAAAHNRNAPLDTQLYSNPASSITPAIQPHTTSLINKFQGQSDTCGCQPPDGALAASPSWVLQGVNLSFAVYNTSGVLQAGWPKDSQTFFHIPNPPNNCDTAPFTSDPRAFYDPNDGRFWVAMLQVEGALGIAPNCPLQSTYWIAVSQTNNPNGSWNVFSFDMTLGQQQVADFTEFGFDSQAVYFSGNMFDLQGNFVFAETLFGGKTAFENGTTPTMNAATDYTANSVALDTVQPVETEARSYSGTDVGFLINSFDINSGGGSCSTGCSGLVVWAIANPASNTPSISAFVVSTRTYTLPPNADQPGCTQCVDTNDTSIAGTPVFHDGLINFALNTGINNGTQVVPGVFWGQLLPTISDTGVITNVSKIQTGVLAFHGDIAAFFGALMPDSDGNLFMIFETMSSTISPKAEFVSRRSTFLPGFFHDTGNTLRSGDAATTNVRWGDYEAASYDGVTSDKVWFEGEYSASNGDWSTFIGSTQFTLSTL